MDDPRRPDGPALAPRPAVIEAMYRAFEGCPLSDPMEYCSYCDTAEHERALHAPLGELPRELVEKYLRDAIHHTGSAEDFAHFVPRLLELDREEELDGFYRFPECLEQAGFAAWPEERRAAVLRALEATAVRGDRGAAWLAGLTRIAGIAWDSVFLGWPGQGDPRSPEAEDLETAIRCGSVVFAEPGGEDADRVNEVFRQFLAGPRGAAFAAAHLARVEAARAGR